MPTTEPTGYVSGETDPAELTDQQVLDEITHYLADTYPRLAAGAVGARWSALWEQARMRGIMP
jgi:hypothetical protein